MSEQERAKYVIDAKKREIENKEIMEYMNVCLTWVRNVYRQDGW